MLPRSNHARLQPEAISRPTGEARIKESVRKKGLRVSDNGKNALCEREPGAVAGSRGSGHCQNRVQHHNGTGELTAGEGRQTMGRGRILASLGVLAAAALLMAPS